MPSKKQVKRKRALQRQEHAPAPPDVGLDASPSPLTDGHSSTAALRLLRPLETLATSDKWTRDRVFGVGAAVCAVLAVAGLSIVSIALVVGFFYVARAFLRPSDQRQRWLYIGCWAFAMATVLSAVLPLVYVLGAANSQAVASADLDSGLLPFRALAALAAIGGVSLTAGTILIAVGFNRTGADRHRQFARSGICIAAYFLLDLPRVISETTSWPGHGYFWSTPLAFGTVALGIVAGLCIFFAFKQRETTEDAPRSLSAAGRQYLLHAAAASLLLPRLIQLGLREWRLPVLDSIAGTASSRYFLYLSSMALDFLLPVLFVVLTLGFLAASVRAGWEPSYWLKPTQTRDTRLLLTWRLPLLWSWLLILVAACTILGYSGFAAAAFAAAHYLWMSAWERQNQRRATR